MFFPSFESLETFTAGDGVSERSISNLLNSQLLS